MKTIIATLFLFSPFVFAAAPDLPTVDHVDLTRYQGKWYEIASIPQFFQRKCVSNTTAEYQVLPTDEVYVLNSCETKEGKRISSEGRARIADSSTNSKLEVSFFSLGGKFIFLFGGKYWIINLEQSYQYAVVGHPDRSYGWILSRTPHLPEDTLASIKADLTAKGYDVCRFMVTPQEGGFDSKVSLCD